MKMGEINVKPPLKHWEDILEQWISLNREIFEHAKGKFAAYSYRERPNVGVMSAAAVRAGWIALEECWSEKDGASGVRNGRADLWLWRNIHHERIEAKFTTDGPSELIKKLRLRHESARADARKLGSPVDARNIALTFVVPRARNNEKEGFEKSVVEVANHCRNLSPKIFASVFPGWVPRLGADKNDEAALDQYRTNVFPGTTPRCSANSTTIWSQTCRAFPTSTTSRPAPPSKRCRPQGRREGALSQQPIEVDRSGIGETPVIRLAAPKVPSCGFGRELRAASTGVGRNPEP
jgi:hypothetical protein